VAEWHLVDIQFRTARHMGGEWERMIQEVLDVFYRLSPETYDGVLTIVIQKRFCWEAQLIVNSRPLIPVSSYR